MHNQIDDTRLASIGSWYGYAVVAVSAEVLIITWGILISKNLMNGKLWQEMLIRRSLRSRSSATQRGFTSPENCEKKSNWNVNREFVLGIVCSWYRRCPSKLDSDDTKNKLSTFVVSLLGIFFAILGGNKILFEWQTWSWPELLINVSCQSFPSIRFLDMRIPSVFWSDRVFT